MNKILIAGVVLAILGTIIRDPFLAAIGIGLVFCGDN